jgi:calcineurin-like phosphoesterase family protein
MNVNTGEGRPRRARAHKAIRRSLAIFVALAIVGLTHGGSSGLGASAEQEVTLLAAGDVAMCGASALDSAAAKTAALIEQIPGTVIVAGDLAYWSGSERDFKNCYDPTWGRFKARTLPVPGNHEYESPEAAPYYAYWGAVAGDPGRGYYSVTVGTWRVIGLNSNIAAGAGSEQERWLREELKSHSAHCTLAFWHHPLFSTGSVGGNTPGMRDIYKALYEGGVDVVVNGHDHVYERFAPQDADGSADPAHGIREFIVGTGGGFATPFRSVPQANSEVRKTGVFGVLKLTLRQEGYAWEFVPIEGQTFRDGGEGKCHD